MDTFALSARPPRAAIAWATKDAIFCEMPCRDGPPYILREHRTAEGLARVLNILIEHAEKPSNAKAPASPQAHPAIRRVGAASFTEDQRQGARAVLKKLGIT